MVARETTTMIDPVTERWRASTVLVVDDHPACQMLIGWHLQKLGVRHSLAQDGHAAFALLTHEHFDLVICDCRMPLMDGYTLARKVRTHEQQYGLRRVPIIALSGSRDSREAQLCREAGMDDWWLKPLTPERLNELFERWLTDPQPGSDAPLAGRSAPPMPVVVPTRASLIELFGSAQTVDLMLNTLLVEVRADMAILAWARLTRDAKTTAERLHRLVGAVAFFGLPDLESQGAELIKSVSGTGVAPNNQRLEQFYQGLDSCLNHLLAK